MRLFNLVEEHHRIRVTANSLGELAAFLVAYITRGTTDELRDLVLAGELRHIEADERVLAAKQVFGEGLRQLGLARARGAQEDERTAGTARIFERGTGAADGLGHRVHRLVLPDDARLEHVLAVEKATRLVFGER